MTALKVIGIILLIFLLIGFLRLGAIVSFGEELRVRVRVGHIKLTILPGREKKPKKPKEPKEEKPEEEKKSEKPKKKRSIPRPTIEEILDLIQTLFSALGAMARRTCRRIRIDPLELSVVFGGEDPAYVAMAYGAVSSMMYATMPKAEERFDIPDPSLHLGMDYGADGTTAEGEFGVSLRVCDLFAILFTLLVPMAKWFLRFKKAHKHDAPAHKGPEPVEKDAENKDIEDRIA